MPRLDGADALAQIRAHPGPNWHVPVLAFTADAECVLDDRMLGFGFSGVVSKPVEPGPLIHAIAEAVAEADEAMPAEVAA